MSDVAGRRLVVVGLASAGAAAVLYFMLKRKQKQNTPWSGLSCGEAPSTHPGRVRRNWPTIMSPGAKTLPMHLPMRPSNFQPLKRGSSMRNVRPKPSLEARAALRVVQAAAKFKMRALMKRQTEDMTALVFDLPEAYIELLFCEDMDQIKADCGCDVDVHQTEQGGWTITLYGSEEARNAGHDAIEELINQRVVETEHAEMQQQAQGDDNMGGGKMVPCTVLPVPYEYLKMIHNLDAIQEITCCTITVSAPGSTLPDGQIPQDEWCLNLFGEASQRQKAHTAIEDTINAEMDKARCGERHS